jgi:hypothetical protein
MTPAPETKTNLARWAPIIVQTLVLVIAWATWKGTVDQTNKEQDRRIAIIEQTLLNMVSLDGRMIRVETRLDAAAITLERIDDKLDRAASRVAPGEQ